MGPLRKRVVGMTSLFARVQEAIYACFSPPRSPSPEPTRMDNVERPKPEPDPSEPAVRHSAPSRATEGKATGDDLLVAKGLPRTRHLREKLVDETGRQPLPGLRMTEAPLFKLDDTDFIKALAKAFSEEFQFLQRADQITVEQGSNPVIGGYGEDENLSPSQLLYGKFFPEVDRTIVGILAMKWILANNYEKFTKYQNKFVKLSEDAFKNMRDIFIEAFGDSSGSYMLIVSMIVNDLGKNSELRDRIKDKEPTRWSVMNHDEVIYHAAAHGKLDLINEFGGEQQQRLMKGIQLGGMLNLGQLAQGECVPGNLEGIAAIMEGDSRAFPMKFCEIVLDVAGAAGHIDSRGANAWIAPVDEAYTNSRECVLKVISGEASTREAYDGILDHRANLLVKKGWKKLDVKDLEQRSILRLITMARAANKNAAQAIEDAVNALPTKTEGEPIKDFFGQPIRNIRDALLKGLMVDGTNDGVAIIPYYGPGVLAESARVTKASSPELQARATAAVFRFFARAFIGTRPMPGHAGHVVDCDISFVQDHIRSEKFLEDPDSLDEVDCPPKRDPYGQDIEELMKDLYNIRRIGRRRTGIVQQQY